VSPSMESSLVSTCGFSSAALGAIPELYSLLRSYIYGSAEVIHASGSAKVRAAVLLHANG